jgi:hypothetical protein
MSLFDSAASVYEQLIQSNSSNEKDLQLKEGQLSWLLHLIGHVIGRRTAHSSLATYDSIDGQRVCRVLQLMNLTDSNLSQVGMSYVFFIKRRALLLLFSIRFIKILIHPLSCLNLFCCRGVVNI